MNIFIFSVDCTFRESFILKKGKKSGFFYNELTACLLLDSYATRGEMSAALVKADLEIFC